MTEENIALSKRLVACKGWRWMPGMLTSDGGRIRAVFPTRIVWDYINDFGSDHASTHVKNVSVLPDLTDPATLGCLLALVRKAWGELGLVACLFKERGEWNVYLPNSDFAVGETEAEALVAALEARYVG